MGMIKIKGYKERSALTIAIELKDDITYLQHTNSLSDIVSVSKRVKDHLEFLINYMDTNITGGKKINIKFNDLNDLKSVCSIIENLESLRY